jgi:gluconate 5-dehydrogenase
MSDKKSARPLGATDDAEGGSSLFSLRGRRALITGGGQGIGFALARGLGAAGAEVVLNDVDPARLEQAVATLRGEGLAVSGKCYDVTNGEAVARGVAAIEEETGAVDILINNAGVHRRAPLEAMPAESWQQVLDVNLTSAFLVSRAVVGGMIRRGSGKIVNICSLNCEVSRPTIANYAAAKGGLKMLTRAMAVEWARHNIQTNGLGPGYIRTAMTGSLTVDAQFDRFIRARTPAGRWGEPRELVGTAVFLASRASDFVNGQILYVDGGLLAAL